MFRQFSSNKSRKKTPAQAVIEFALALPILLLVMYGLIEAGRLIFIYASVVTASRQAVRYGAAIGVNDAGTPHFQDCAGIKAAARNVAFLSTFNDADILITYDRGLDASGNVVLIPGFDPPDCPIPNFADGTPIIRNGDRIKVQVSAQFSPILRLVPLQPFIITSMGSRTLLVSVPIEVDSPEEGWAGYEFTLAKSASPTTYSLVGQEITYTYTLRNAGTTSISGPFSIDDDKVARANIDCSAVPDPLAGGSSAKCSGTYVITQKDLDDGRVTNEATALANGAGSNPATATITAEQKYELTLEKSASPKAAATVGQIITYTYTLKNTGNVTLTSPYTISDNKVQNSDISCSGAASPLAPGASTTCSGTYAIKNSDLNAGSVTNYATATAQFGTQTVTSNAASATVLTKQLVLYKAAFPTTVDMVGQFITYTYTLYNAGVTQLSSPYSVTDDRVASVDCSAAASPLAPGASTTCSGTYVVTQADLDVGSVVNFATATAMNGTLKVTSNQASATVAAVQIRQLTLTKSASPTTATTLGQFITYTYTLKNTGNLTVTSPYSVTDDKVLNVNCSGAVSPLPPGASTTCTGTYSVTQADLDAGSIINHATATATTSQTGGASKVASNQASAIVITYLAPRLNLQKSANPTSATAVGQKITYTYYLRNTGNTILTPPYSVTDDKIPNVDCSAVVIQLQIGQTITCTGTYTVTQADLDARSITNHATATAWSGGQLLTSNQAVLTIVATPPIPCVVRHSALTTSPFGMTIFNDTALYSITIKQIQIYWNNATEPNQKITSLSLGGILISNTSNAGSPSIYSTFIGNVAFAPNSNKFLQVNFQSAYKPSGTERILVTFAENGCPILDSSNSSQLAP